MMKRVRIRAKHRLFIQPGKETLKVLFETHFSDTNAMDKTAALG